MKTGKNSSRGLSDAFMQALQVGLLSPLLEMVKADPTLDLQIRDEYINIYYRGGCLLKVQRKGAQFHPSFAQVSKSGDNGYSQQLSNLLSVIGCPLKIPTPWDRPFNQIEDVQTWVATHLPVSKLMMDVSNRISVERDVQQRITQVNNRGNQANGTDWYIADTQFAVPVQMLGNPIVLDMLALHWPSTPRGRMTPDQLEWALVELKTGNKAIDGAAGLDKHLTDMIKMLSDDAYLEVMQNQVQLAINQRIELKLIPDLKHAVKSLSTKPPLLIFLLADVDPATSQFNAWLSGLAKQPKSVRDSIRFFVAHLMGYALHDKYLLTVDEVQRYVAQCWKQG